VFRYLGDFDWVDTEKLGQELEAMPLLVCNGKMVEDNLPLAETPWRTEKPSKKPR
jgi:hypothetical protein